MFQKVGLMAALAAIAVFALSTVSFGGSARVPTSVTNKSALDAKPMKERVGHRVATPTGATASFVSGAHLRYFETDPFPIAGGSRSDSYILCPNGYKAINGYFNTDGGIVEDRSYNGPAFRRWNFGLIDLTGVPGVAYVGIVCLNGIGQ
jgi:hypothetical protein